MWTGLEMTARRYWARNLSPAVQVSIQRARTSATATRQGGETSTIHAGRGDMFDFAAIYDATNVCDCCQRISPRVRGSMWHGDHRICSECFAQWYDPDNGSFDNRDPMSLGNYVRQKNGLEPISRRTGEK
jgi:hypothetical protein